MQAFEQCHGLTHGYVGDYIFLMGLFVSASKDVEMLVENRIIENWLPSNEEVVQLFYNLNKQNSVWSGTFLFKGLIKDLNAFCETPWNKWKANLKAKLFQYPMGSSLCLRSCYSSHSDCPTIRLLYTPSSLASAISILSYRMLH
jgi:hypothetical protein